MRAGHFKISPENEKNSQDIPHKKTKRFIALPKLWTDLLLVLGASTRVRQRFILVNRLPCDETIRCRKCDYQSVAEWKVVQSKATEKISRVPCIVIDAVKPPQQNKRGLLPEGKR